MEAVMDKGRISFEIVRLRTSIEQWERDVRDANRDRTYAAAGKKAGLVLFAAGLALSAAGVLAALVSYAIVGVYVSTVGLGVVVVSKMREGGSRERLRDLGDQLVYSKRRLVELNIRLESDLFDW